MFYFVLIPHSSFSFIFAFYLFGLFCSCRRLFLFSLFRYLVVVAVFVVLSLHMYQRLFQSANDIHSYVTHALAATPITHAAAQKRANRFNPSGDQRWPSTSQTSTPERGKRTAEYTTVYISAFLLKGQNEGMRSQFAKLLQI